MRGISTDSSHSTGFVLGILFTLLVAGAVRVARWASSTDVVAAVVTWATTPSISPAGLVLNAMPILFILLMLVVLSGYMAIGPRRI